MNKYNNLFFLPIFLPILSSTALKNFFLIPVFLYSLYCVISNKDILLKNIYIISGFIIFFIVLPLFSSIAIGYIPDKSTLNEFVKLVTYLIYFLALVSLKQKTQLSDFSFLLKFFLIYNISLCLIIFIDDSIAEGVFFLYHVESDSSEFMQYLFSRPSGAFGNPNALGVASCLCSIFFLRTKQYLFLVFSLLLILLTQSRTSFICFLIVFFLNLVVEKRFLVILFLSLSFSSILSILSSIDNPLIEALFNRFSNIDLAGRDSLWNKFFESNFLEQSFFGLFTIPAGITFLDNEYLNIYVRYGFVSTSIALLILIYLITFHIYQFIIENNKYADSYKANISIILVYSLIVIMLTSITASISTMLKFFLFFLFFYIYLKKVFDNVE